MTQVLLLYEKFIPSVRLCAYEQLNYLAKKGFFEFNHCQTDKVSRDQCENADVVVFVRTSTELDLILAQKFKEAGKFIAYVLDDDLLHIEKGLTLTPYYQMKVVRRRIKTILEISDMLISPSQYLLHKYSVYVKRTVRIEEPCLYRHNSKFQKDRIKIGFAGSPDRNKDINEILDNVITHLYNKYRDIVEFEFFGAKPSVVDKLNLKFYSYEENYEIYQNRIASLNWDIGLAPMSSTEFKKCKYYNKYTEYGAIQCVGVYSKVKPYTDIIIDGYNGLLCDNTVEEWITKLEDIIFSQTKLLAMKEDIKREMDLKFNVEIVGHNYLINFQELQYYKAPKSHYPLFTFYRNYAKVTRIKEFVIRNKWNTPIRLIQKLIGQA